MAADLWTKPIGWNRRPAYRQPVNRIHHRHLLLLLSPKADTHFTVPRRVEGWVDLGGCYIQRWFSCLFPIMWMDGMVSRFTVWLYCLRGADRAHWRWPKCVSVYGAAVSVCCNWISVCCQLMVGRRSYWRLLMLHQPRWFIYGCICIVTDRLDNVYTSRVTFAVISDWTTAADGR